MKKIMRKILSIIRLNLNPEIQNLKFFLGQNAILASRSMSHQFKYLWDAEVKVFSQWGEDGILDYICNQLEINKPRILEIGAGNFVECNSRFLVENRNASAVLVDGRKDLTSNVNTSNFKWKTHLYALEKWVTPINIVDIINYANNYISGIDILSIDLDGNDYWILEAANLSDVKVVVVEYNPLFGSDFAVTVPRDDDFDRTKKHSSWLYYGASLKAFVFLLEQKGFAFVGTNRVGNNAFFVEANHLGKIGTKLPNLLSAHTDWRVRESRNNFGELNFLSGHDRVIQIQEMLILDVVSGNEMKVSDLFSGKT